MNRIMVLKSLDKFREDLAHDPIFEDLSNYSPELQWLLNDYKKLIVEEETARNKYSKEVSDHLKTKVSYTQTAGKLKRFKKRMSQIREIAESENPSIKDIRYLANGYEMREDK